MAYKILWYSIPSLHDTSNGAAIRCKLMLEKLQQRGIEIKVLTALVGDDAKGLGIFNQIIEQIKPDPNASFFKFYQNGIEYIVAKTKGRDMDSIVAPDQSLLFSLFTQLTETFEPDMLMGYSGDLFSTVIRREAKARGLSVVYALCNGLHSEYNFPDCDLVFTTSKATAQLYLERDGVKIESVGNFIDENAVIAPKESRQAKYVTLVNPSYHKGIAVFVKLALAYTQKHKDENQRFLIIKSTGDYARIMLSLHHKDGTPLIEQNKESPISMIDVAEHTNDIRGVYALSKVLVVPSLWHESWGRVATEANFNGIPVLATQGDGLYEAIGDGKGGICLAKPQSSVEDNTCLPTDEEIAPYVEALERLLNEDWTERCAQAAAQNSIENSVDRLYNLIEPLLKQGQENKCTTSNSFYFNAKTMSERDAKFKELKAQIAQNQAQQAKAEQNKEKMRQSTTNAKKSKAKSKRKKK